MKNFSPLIVLENAFAAEQNLTVWADSIKLLGKISQIRLDTPIPQLRWDPYSMDSLW
jgi:hypothetical protein